MTNQSRDSVYALFALYLYVFAIRKGAPKNVDISAIRPSTASVFVSVSVRKGWFRRPLTFVEYVRKVQPSGGSVQDAEWIITNGDGALLGILLERDPEKAAQEYLTNLPSRGIV